MNSDEASFAWRTLNLNWLPVALLGAVLFCTIACTDFSVEPIGFGVAIALGLFLALIAYGSALVKPQVADPKVVFWFGTTAQVIVVTAIVGPLSYVANAMNWPLQDHTLLLIDRAIGLDPQPIAAFVNDHSWLAKYLSIGYGFIKWPLLGIPIILTMTLRLDQAAAICTCVESCTRRDDRRFSLRSGDRNVLRPEPVTNRELPAD